MTTFSQYRALGAVLLASLVLVLSGCGAPSESSNEPAAVYVAADSDNSYTYQGGDQVEADPKVYTIKGTVVGAPDALVRQTNPASGDLKGAQLGDLGFVTGSFTGPVQEGKGFVRLKVESISPSLDIVAPGATVILKTTDTKVTALLPTDRVTFKCRTEIEVVSPAYDREELKIEQVGTRELDFCRMATPVFTASK